MIQVRINPLVVVPPVSLARMGTAASMEYRQFAQGGPILIRSPMACARLVLGEVSVALALGHLPFAVTDNPQRPHLLPVTFALPETLVKGVSRLRVALELIQQVGL